MRHSSIAMLASAFLAVVFVSTPMAAAVAENTAGVNVRAAQMWTVSEAPQGGWDVYLTAEQLEPGFWTGPHTHPGPEYALIVKGEIQQWDDGTRHEVKTGDGYFIPANVVHEVGDASPDQALLVSTHIIPRGQAFNVPLGLEQAPAGAPKRAPGHTRLWQTTFQLGRHPLNAFRLTEQVVDLPGGRRFSPDPGAATRFVVVMAGTVIVEESGRSYDVGQSYTVSANASGTVMAGTMPTSIMVTSIEGK